MNVKLLTGWQKIARIIPMARFNRICSQWDFYRWVIAMPVMKQSSANAAFKLFTMADLPKDRHNPMPQWRIGNFVAWTLSAGFYTLAPMEVIDNVLQCLKVTSKEVSGTKGRFRVWNSRFQQTARHRQTRGQVHEKGRISNWAHVENKCKKVLGDSFSLL